MNKIASFLRNSLNFASFDTLVTSRNDSVTPDLASVRREKISSARVRVGERNGVSRASDRPFRDESSAISFRKLSRLTLCILYTVEESDDREQHPI